MGSVLKSALVAIDAGGNRGLGHLRRCQTLLVAFQQLSPSTQVTFLSDEPVGELLSGFSFEQQPLEQWAAFAQQRAPDLLLVDSYRVVGPKGFREAAPFLVQMDDWGHVWNEADIVINPVNEEPAQTEAFPWCLYGTPFSLIRPAFAEKRRPVRAQLERVLISLGGSIGTEVLQAVGQKVADVLGGPLEIRFVLGPFAKQGAISITGDQVKTVLLQSPDMIEEVTQADLAVSGGGQMLYEFAAAGIPMIALETADNQRQNITMFLKAEAAFNGGIFGQRWESELKASLEKIKSEQVRKLLSKRGVEFVDGQGAHRAALLLLRGWKNRLGVR